MGELFQEGEDFQDGEDFQEVKKALRIS